MNVLHPGADGDILRANLFAIQALNAQIGARFFRNKGIGDTSAADVLVHNAFVVNAQVFGNVDTLGAGQAIFASGAVDGAEFLIFDADFIKKP